MHLNDDSLLQEFVIESREHLASIEPDLLVLERDAQHTDAEIINRIFRAIHSIKGASGFFGLQALKCLSHSMENTLMLVRDGKLMPNSNVVDPLLIGVDRLRDMLEDIGQSEQIAYQDITASLEQLTGHNSKLATIEGSNSYQNNESEFSFHPDVALIEEAVRHGQHLYSITVKLNDGFYKQHQSVSEFVNLLRSTGDILDASTDLNDAVSVQASIMELSILYASVLEPALMASTFPLEENQLKPVSMSEVLANVESDHSEKQSDVLHETASPNPDKSADKDLNLLSVPAEKPKMTAASQHADSNETIRVKVDLLNKLMDLAGELVLARNQLNRMFETQLDSQTDMSTIIQNVDLVTSDLQEHIMQTRMQPVASVFGKFPRLVRDLSRQLDKEVFLEMSGEEVELDKSILENLSDPLTHLIRNCCDHALEKPDVREANGKARQGKILLKAYQESGHINIAITDDGAGIDHEKVAKKALEKGLVSDAALRQMSVQEQVNLIFMPGFSTAETVTDVSGRGVGMDVVRTNIEQIGGSISIETEKGQGTTILLRLPLTLAIIPSLVVTTGHQIFAVPQINLVELVCVTTSQIANRIERVGSATVLRLRGKLLPLVKLSEVLGLNPDDRRELIHDERNDGNTVPEESQTERRVDAKSDYNILVLKSGFRHYGLIVDEIRDIEEIVVKPLSSFIKNCKCFSGATIMGDGRVAMILDVAGIIATSNLSYSELSLEEQKRQKATALEQVSLEISESRSVLLFNNAANEIFAMPLDSILRLEKIETSSVEQVGRQKFLPYQGRSMSLIYLHEVLSVSPICDELAEAYLIIPKEGNCTVGIMASAILDTIEFGAKLEPSLTEIKGVLGTAVINQHVTTFLSPEGLLEMSGYSILSDKTIDDTGKAMAWQPELLQPSC